MLFNDPSCIPEYTIQSQMKNNIPQLLGSDWFGIIVLSQNLKFKIDAKHDFSDVGDEVILDFLNSYKAKLIDQEYRYQLFEFNLHHYAIIPIRKTDSYVVFFVHFRSERSGPFDPKDLKWNIVYGDAAYRTLLINNDLIQELDYIENVIESTESAIIVFDLKYNIVSHNTFAKELFNIDRYGRTIDDINLKHIIDTDKLHAAFERVMWTGKKEELRNMIFFENGKSRLLNVIISPLRNSKKVISGCVLVGNDITKAQILEYQFEQLKHYAWLGEITYSLSHDVKNPLTNIKGCAAVLKKNKSLQEKDLSILNLITQEVDRIDGIIQQMLSFGNVTKQNDFTYIDINEVIYNCIQIINRQKVYRDINVTHDLDQDTPLIKAKNEDLQQIFLNILNNSLQAIENQGIINVKSHFDKNEEMLCINIYDNGIGINPETMDKLFQPYITTKKNGTGLGLYIVKNGLKKYGGKILMSSKLSEGTMCEITLPIKFEG